MSPDPGPIDVLARVGSGPPRADAWRAPRVFVAGGDGGPGRPCSRGDELHASASYAPPGDPPTDPRSEAVPTGGRVAMCYGAAAPTSAGAAKVAPVPGCT